MDEARGLLLRSSTATCRGACPSGRDCWHALWNGSTVVLDAWLVDASVVTQFIVFVGWILFLIALVLQAGRRLFAAALMDAQTSRGTF